MSGISPVGGAIKTCVANYGVNPEFVYALTAFTIVWSIIIVVLARRLL